MLLPIQDKWISGLTLVHCERQLSYCNYVILLKLRKKRVEKLY